MLVHSSPQYFPQCPFRVNSRPFALPDTHHPGCFFHGELSQLLNLNDRRMVCRKSQIASLRSFPSRAGRSLSGFGEGPVRPTQSLCVDSPKLWMFSRLRFLRRVISAELIAMRVSHVEKLDLPSKFLLNEGSKRHLEGIFCVFMISVMRCVFRISLRA